jgi:hypothetical protein
MENEVSEMFLNALLEGEDWDWEGEKEISITGHNGSKIFTSHPPGLLRGKTYIFILRKWTGGQCMHACGMRWA